MNAMTTYIQDQLSRLDEFLPLIDYDIGKMNLHQCERRNDYRPSYQYLQGL
jgi:hypothetical protein